MRGSGLIAHHRHLLLVRNHSCATGLSTVRRCTNGNADVAVPTRNRHGGKATYFPRFTIRSIPLGMLLRDNINDTHVAFRIMLGGRCRDNLYILYMPGRDLLQSLCTREDTRLTIYVNQKAAASTKVTSPSASTRMEGVFSNISTAEPPPPIILEEASTTFLSSL